MEISKDQAVRSRCRGFYGLSVLPLLAIIVSLLPLTDIAKNFEIDWYNHLWTIEYFGRYLQHHGRPPDILNTRDMVGLISPVFYASKFYTLLGLLSIPFDSALTFRLFAVTLMAVQVYHVHRAAKAVCPDPLFRTILTFAVAAEVYRVIAIYERGALTEFTAFAFLTMSVCTFMVLLLRIGLGKTDRYGLVSTGLFYSIGATIHPLTGVFGGIVLALLGVVGFVVLRRLKLLVFGLSNAIGAALMLGPWLDPLLKFGKLVRIANPNFNFGYFQGSVWTGPLRNLLSGLNPWSFGPFYVRAPVPDWCEPKVPWSFALLILSFAGLFLWRRFPRPSSRVTRNLLCSVLALSYAVGLVCILVFCSPNCSSFFGNFFDILQFPFRLIAYVNLCLLLATLCLFGMVDWRRLDVCSGWRRWRVRIAILVFLIAAAGLTSKVAYVQFVRFSASGTKGLEDLLRLWKLPARPAGYWIPGCTPRSDTHLDELPATYFWLSDYEVVSCYQSYASNKNVPNRQVTFGAGPVLGSLVPCEVDLAKPTLLVTNVIPFPWNVIKLDGREVRTSDLIACPISYPIRDVQPKALGLMAGPGHHVLSYEFRPDKYWPFLRDLSWVTLMVWMALWAGVFVGKLRAPKPAAEGAESSVVPDPFRKPARKLPVLTH
ncbi:MAG: hypothetical protein JOY92_03510 [Verrucomicrobia bacterium]|nr:hypothetical protein [Verrucomicrobiota bacterium]